MRTLPLVPIVVLALVAGGCGGSSKTTSTAGTNPTASAPGATAPPSDATQPGTNPVTTQTKTQKPKAKTNPQTASIPQYSSTTSSGAPRTRLPADFVVRGGKLVPAGISGPAGIPIDVSVRSGDGKPHTLLIEVPPKLRTLSVAPGGRATLRIPGLKAGAYGIELDGHVAGGLLIGRQPGP